MFEKSRKFFGENIVTFEFILQKENEILLWNRGGQLDILFDQKKIWVSFWVNF